MTNMWCKKRDITIYVRNTILTVEIYVVGNIYKWQKIFNTHEGIGRSLKPLEQVMLMPRYINTYRIKKNSL